MSTTLLTDPRGIRYQLLDAGTVPGMTSLLSESFSRYEPPALAAGLSVADVGVLVTIFVPKALTEGLTIVATEPSGQVVGTMLNEDFGTPPPEELHRAPAAFAPIGAMLEDLDNQYRAAHRVRPGSHLHLFMLAVASTQGGRGVAQTLVRLSLEEAVRRRYTTGVTEATGRVSQRVFGKLGFRAIYTAPYADVTYQGRRVFASIAEAHGGVVLMERVFETDSGAV